MSPRYPSSTDDLPFRRKGRNDNAYEMSRTKCGPELYFDFIHAGRSENACEMSRTFFLAQNYTFALYHKGKGKQLCEMSRTTLGPELYLAFRHKARDENAYEMFRTFPGQN